MRNGLIVGRFLVPHVGQRRLISLASTMVDRLDVLLMSRPDDPIVAEERMSWLEEHLGRRARFRIMRRPLPTEFDYQKDDAVRTLWEHSILDHLSGRRPHVVFGRKDFDRAVADILGAEFHQPDQDLPELEASGQALFANPYDRWDQILPAARPLFAKRIAIAGGERAERNGTALRLAQRLGTIFVPDRGAGGSTEERAAFEHVIARGAMRAYVVAEENVASTPSRPADFALVLPDHRAEAIAGGYEAAGARAAMIDSVDVVDALADNAAQWLGFTTRKTGQVFATF